MLWDLTEILEDILGSCGILEGHSGILEDHVGSYWNLLGHSRTFWDLRGYSGILWEPLMTL